MRGMQRGFMGNAWDAGSPPRAGNTYRTGLGCGDLLVHPRGCGEDRLSRLLLRLTVGSPPRAGKASGGCHPACRRRVHPRACREYWFTDMVMLCDHGSPLCGQGIQNRDVQYQIETGLTPGTGTLRPSGRNCVIGVRPTCGQFTKHLWNRQRSIRLKVKQAAQRIVDGPQSVAPFAVRRVVHQDRLQACGEPDRVSPVR